MHFEKLVPDIFYIDITEGLKLFVDCLEFKIAQNELKSNNPQRWFVFPNHRI